MHLDISIRVERWWWGGGPHTTVVKQKHPAHCLINGEDECLCGVTRVPNQIFVHASEEDIKLEFFCSSSYDHL